MNAFDSVLQLLAIISECNSIVFLLFLCCSLLCARLAITFDSTGILGCSSSWPNLRHMPSCGKFSYNNFKRIFMRLYSSVVERQSCKLKVLGSIPSGGYFGFRHQKHLMPARDRERKREREREGTEREREREREKERI